MSTLSYAEHELSLIGLTKDDPEEMNRMMYDNIMQLLQVFSDQGHSGFSAAYLTSILVPLLRHEPITPLTGDESEWEDVSQYGGNTKFQNKRCSRVFKDVDGSCYDINGKVFITKEVNSEGKEYDYSYTSKDSKVDVIFPYIPKTEYVRV